MSTSSTPNSATNGSEKEGLFSRLAKNIKSTKRRIKQQAYEKFDASLETVDKEFDDLYRKFTDTEGALMNLREHLEQYMAALKSVSALQTVIAGDLLYFYDTKATHRPAAQQYLMKLQELNASAGVEVMEKLSEKVVEPIRSHLQEFPAVKELMEKRARKKIDLDSYRRKAASLAKKERDGKEKIDPERKKKVEEKLQQAANMFGTLNDDLFNSFSQYEKIRPNLLNGHFADTVSAQLDFYTAGHNSFASLRTLISELTMAAVHKLSLAALDLPSADEDVPAKDAPKRGRAGAEVKEVKFFKNPPYICSRSFADLHREYDPHLTGLLPAPTWTSTFQADDDDDEPPPYAPLSTPTSAISSPSSTSTLGIPSPSVSASASSPLSTSLATRGAASPSSTTPSAVTSTGTPPLSSSSSNGIGGMANVPSLDPINTSAPSYGAPSPPTPNNGGITPTPNNGGITPVARRVAGTISGGAPPLPTGRRPAPPSVSTTTTNGPPGGPSTIAANNSGSLTPPLSSTSPPPVLSPRPTPSAIAVNGSVSPNPSATTATAAVGPGHARTPTVSKFNTLPSNFTPIPLSASQLASMPAKRAIPTHPTSPASASPTVVSPSATATPSPAVVNDPFVPVQLTTQSSSGHHSTPPPPPPPPRNVSSPPLPTCTANFPYVAQRAEELSFNEGDTFTITKKDPSGWWTVTSSVGRSGVVPSNYMAIP